MSGSEPGGAHNEISGTVHGDVVQAHNVYGDLIVYAGDADRTARAREFEERFRRGVLKLLDRVELWGLDDLPWHLREHRLSSAYLSLSLETATEGHDGSGRRVEDVVAGRRRLLLEGHAGSGKTTALRHLALQGLRGELLREGDDAPAMVPFLVKMRSCYEDGRLRMPAVEELAAKAAATIAPEKPERWVGDLLAHGRGMVFLDGVDEVAEKDRPDVLRWLEDLLAYYPDASYVLTSRPAAIRESWRRRLRGHGFATARLESMTPTQVSAFIDRWHRAVAESGGLDPEWLDRSARTLKGELAARRDLATLARSPLMCAVLSAMCVSRGEIPLPRPLRRSALIDFLLERRDMARQIRGYSGARYLLAPLAYWLVMEGEETLPAKTAVRLLNRTTHGDADDDRMLRLMLEQSGLLEMVDGDRVGFRFPGFQDQLAAQQFLDQLNHRHLVTHAYRPAYQDVVIAAVEQEAERGSWELLAALADRAARSRRHGRERWLLAAACIADLPMDDRPELAARIREATRTYLPPRDLGEADAIARAGEFVLDLLADTVRSGLVTDDTAPAVIRAAALVDADQAIPLIRGFRHSASPQVQRELAAAWCRVREFGDYAREVLADAALGDTWLDLPHLSALPELGAIAGLRRLRLPREADAATLARLTEIDGLPARLEALSLADTAVTDLTSLAGLPRLRLLDISRTKITELGPLDRVPGLEVRPAAARSA